MPENLRCRMSEIYKTHIPNDSMMIYNKLLRKEKMDHEILYYIDCCKGYGAIAAIL